MLLQQVTCEDGLVGLEVKCSLGQSEVMCCYFFALSNAVLQRIIFKTEERTASDDCCI